MFSTVFHTMLLCFFHHEYGQLARQLNRTVLISDLLDDSDLFLAPWIVML